MSNAILRSYQVFGADDQVLTAAAEAVKKAVKDAKSKGAVQKVTLSRKGYRHDLEVGDIYVVPTSVCDDPEDFPTILLNANLRQHTTGEGMVEFQMGALADPKELSRETLQDFKKVCFKNSKGDIAPLIVFAAAWAHPSAYQSFAYDEDTLVAMLRDVAYASPFDPSLSSAFDQLKAVDPDSAAHTRIAPVTQHIFSMPKSKDPVYPTFAKGLEIAGADGDTKKASLDVRASVRLRRTAADIPEVSGEELSGDEVNLFQSLEAELGAMVQTTDPKKASTYVDPMPMQGEMGLRAQPDYGAPDSKEQIHPAMVDGPDPKQASDETPVQVSGVVPNTPTEIDNKAPEGAENAGAATVKEAAFAQDTVQCVNKFVETWGGRLMNGAQLKAELAKVTDKLKAAVVFMKDQGLLVQEGQDTFKVQNRDMLAESKLPPKRSYLIRNAHDKRVWAAQNLEGLVLGGEWSPDRSEAHRFASINAAQEEIRRHRIAGEAQIVAKECKCDGDCECTPKENKLASWWSPGAVVEQFYPELLHNQVDSPFIMQTESPDLVNPFGAPGKQEAQDTSGLGLNQGIESGGGSVPLRQEMNFYGPEYARSFYGPKDNMSPGSLKLKQHPLAASTRTATWTPTYDSDKKSMAAMDPATAQAVAAVMEFATANYEAGWDTIIECMSAQDVADQLGGVTDPKEAIKHMAEMVGARVDQALDARWGDADDPQLDTARAFAESDPRKTGSAPKNANPALLAVPAVAEAAAVAAPAAAAPAAGASGLSTALSIAPALIPGDDKQASQKKADGALALFQGLAVASPEEHPQAHFDESAPNGTPTPYNEPSKVDAVPQDDAFLSLDTFLKGVVAAYAAQLIGAFKATNKPLTLATPYQDTLDLAATLEFAGGAAATPDAVNSAKAQFSQALGNMNDDQRKMLLDNAMAQAAVWCPNTQGSGGFNYEVFVRAEKLDGTSLTVKVVTGAKGGK